MKKTIYIETTIPSAYFDIRNNTEAITRKNWTHQCWKDINNENYNMVTSEAVIMN